jgi:hypothetical protein
MQKNGWNNHGNSNNTNNSNQNFGNFNGGFSNNNNQNPQGFQGMNWPQGINPMLAMQQNMMNGNWAFPNMMGSSHFLAQNSSLTVKLQE